MAVLVISIILKERVKIDKMLYEVAYSEFCKRNLERNIGYIHRYLNVYGYFIET